MQTGRNGSSLKDVRIRFERIGMHGAIRDESNAVSIRWSFARSK